MRVRLTLAGVAIAAATLGTTSSAWAEPDTLTVCADPGACDHTTITAAVAAASNFDTIDVSAGIYDEETIVVDKPLTILGPNAGISPNDPLDRANANLSRVPEATVVSPPTGPAFEIVAPMATVEGFRFTDPGTAGESGTPIIGAGWTFGGDATDVLITNNLFDGVSPNAVTFNSPSSSMEDGSVVDNRVVDPTRAAGCGVDPVPEVSCDHNLFDLWQTDNVQFSGNAVLDAPGSRDGVTAVLVTSYFPNSDSGSNGYTTVFDNTVRYSCDVACLALVHGNRPVQIEDNDLTLQAGDGIHISAEWVENQLVIQRNRFHGPNGYLLSIRDRMTLLDGLVVVRNSIQGGGIDAGEEAGQDFVNANCNWWGNAAGPQPGQNVGPVIALAFLRSADLASGCRANTALGLEYSARSMIETLHRDTTYDPIFTRAEQAITASVEHVAWRSDDELWPDDGNEVFELTRRAVRRLAEVVSSGAPADLSDPAAHASNRLVRSDRRLALRTINSSDHSIPGADWSARQTMHAGDELAAAGHDADAITKYRNAWLQVIGAR